MDNCVTITAGIQFKRIDLRAKSDLISRFQKDTGYFDG